MRWSYKPWRERTQAERFEAAVRWSLYPLSAAPPLVYAAQLAAGWTTGWPNWALLLPFLAHTVINLFQLDRSLDDQPLDRRLTTAQLVLAAGLVVGLAATRGEIDYGWLTTPLLAQALVIIGTAASWAPPLKLRRLGWLALGASVVLFAVHLPYGLVFATALGIPQAVWGCIWLSVYASSGWMLRVVRELDRARGTAARLAVAEERLRFSRDLHDVFGRVLSTVAVKSELAAELTPVRPEQAAATMLEVRQLAQDSLTEVRAVAAGYRQADLGAELRGARGLLDSAGIACTVRGEDLDFPEQVRTAFGWAVREAVTNVIRHSTATRCAIELARDPGECRLEVGNDGVVGRTGDGGTGLAGLAERLAPLGGRLSTERSGDRFVLRVTLPNGEER